MIYKRFGKWKTWKHEKQVHSVNDASEGRNKDRIAE